MYFLLNANFEFAMQKTFKTFESMYNHAKLAELIKIKIIAIIFT